VFRWAEVNGRVGTTRRSLLRSGFLASAGLWFGDALRPAAVAEAAAPAPQAGTSVVGTPPLTNAGYWEFADWLQGALDRLWSESSNTYTNDTRINACVLMTHAIAALEGHEGPARRDARARALAARLCESPPFRAPRGRPTRHANPRSETQLHAPGWVSNMARRDSQMHLSVDPKVARALYYAWRAREQLELPQATVDRMVQCVRSVANSPFFRYPNIRLNQINFAAEIQACAVSMTDDPRLLRTDYRRQLTRFLRGAKRPTRPWRIPNLGPSYGFHRNPFQRSSAPQNIESAEYANIALDVIYYYQQARDRGMRPISESHGRTLRAFVRRALSAYWTHSGYVNWDTGLYLYRWHLSRYWAWCGQGLLAIASSKNFVRDEERRWAKHMFDCSLALYERFCERWDDDRREPGSSLYGITTKFSEGRHFELARFQALAAEAILRGMGDDPATEPPPMYAFDPSIGRLAITTPTYNTAIVATSNGAFPYGGIDIARWFDSRQRVVSHIGGRAPASFGMLVRAPNGTVVTASQRPLARPQRRGLPLILNRSPIGPITKVRRYPSTPSAGRFDTLETGGLIDRAGVRFRARYVFVTDHIQVHWQITRTRRDSLTAEVTWPSWGDGVLNAVMRSGQIVKLAGAAFVFLRDVRYFFIDGTEGGYVLVPRSFPPTATAHVIKPSEQSSNPRPGPSVSVRLAAGTHWHEVQMRVTMAPARNGDEAAAVAPKLGAV
jgi:hypothetical protein